MKQDVRHARLIYNGIVRQGVSFGANVNAAGEFVFNTAMSGYEEILTDPSYADQIIVFTYPHIGNTGINLQDHESEHIYAKGVIVSDYVEHYSNYRAKTSLATWLRQKNIPAISNVDTRALVKQIRTLGSMQGEIQIESAKTTLQAHGVRHDKSAKLFAIGSKNKKPIIVVDMGVKHSILVQLAKSDHPIYLVSPSTTLLTLQKYHPHAIVFSNGPGNPKDYPDAIELARDAAMADMPILGICLGFQIVALALGGRTTKLVFGHHGSNHPVKHLESGEVFITSQNHNYIVDEASLPEELAVTHRSLFDNTVQGFCHKSKTIYAFQGHPEAGPGPLEMLPYFENFLKKIA